MMARRDSDFELRMSGILYAYKIAKEKGIEELEKDIKMRGVLSIPLGYTKGDMDRFLEYLKTNFYNSIMSVACIALEETFGFKKTRLQRFKEAFAKATTDMMDLDYIGENYVTLEDYAVYLNDRYDLDIDVEVVSVCQENANANHPDYHMVKAERLIEVMRQDGYEDAAAYLEWRAGIIDRPLKRHKTPEARIKDQKSREKTKTQEKVRQQEKTKQQKGEISHDRRKEDKKRA